jgi:hypothetical protein
VPKMGHSLDDAVVADVVWSGIAGFLQQHLGVAVAAVVPPAAAGPAAASATDGAN